jgi:magnesium transporter
MATDELSSEDAAQLSPDEFIKLSAQLHPAQVADFLKERSLESAREILLGISPQLASDVFGHLSEERQLAVSEDLGIQQLATIVTNMNTDERVDFFQALPEERQESLFRRLAQSEREDIIRLGSYEEGTAGAAMTSEYITLPQHVTALEAIAKLRREAPDKETIYDSYVVDSERRLIGVVSLKNLILARPSALVDDIMNRNVISIDSSDDQEVAAQTIAKYDMIALPVVNPMGALVGIITHDDVIDILQEEHTEDVEKLMAITSSAGGDYLITTPWEHFRRRATWVVSLAILGLASGFILHANEDILSRFVILALYMPMMADTGGHIGGQAVAVIVRAIATQQVQLKDGFRILFKELQVALMMAVVLGLLAYGKIMMLSTPAEIPNGFSIYNIAGAITLALVCQVFTATFIGAGLPLLAVRLKLDPAVVAAPALTTIVDMVGIFLYFKIATALIL